ncbi:MAG: DUF2868 domain-containing protein [Candidimonas sp.]|nr:MAG: DUF2868 domain-containing protein [Candidimonas sp.]TAM20050.1 MAG: DUF2868 domain-containing protein [Candidimonas sp.]TAM77094.1 MAG: DUF2868 domain-containing protein [Candidimonas sp.]
MPSVDSFSAYWLAEFIRLREAHWGPIEDASETRRARTEGHNFTQRILLRATLLGKRENLDLLIARWSRGARIALLGLIIAAVLAGAGTAMGALGDGGRSVNLLLALVAILGLHGLTFLLWLLSFGIRGHGSWLGQLWLWLTRKLARGPDVALIPRALVDVLGRNGALRWILSSVSHGLWTGAFLTLLLTLLAALSARRYEFNWETTLLSADTFVQLTAVIGWLPGKLGFLMPSADMVRASNGLHAVPESVQALWSSWLIGCVVVYGLLPRLLSLLLSLFMSRRCAAAITLDENLPGYANLRERLQPSSEKIGVDSPAFCGLDASIRSQAGTPGQGAKSLIVGIELPADEPWPPQALAQTIQDAGNIDTREQRMALLDDLQDHAPEKLLAVCDPHQTPDRGTISILTDLAGLARQTRVLLRQDLPGERDARMVAWRSRLGAAGFESRQIYAHRSDALAWLEAQTDE